MSLCFRLDDYQTRAFRMVQPGRVCTYPFGRGGGKTFLLRTLTHSLSLSEPRHVGLLYPSLKQAKGIVWDGLFADFATLVRQGIVRRYHRSDLTAEYANGSRLTTWGAENADAIRGQRFDALLEDETDDIDPEVERAVVQPTFSRSGVNAIWVKFGTPRKGRAGSLYASYSKAERQEREGLEARTHYGFKLRSAESPQVDQAWLAQVREELYAAGKGATYEREYECNFDSAEGLVYPTFSLDLHVQAPDYGYPYNEILVGIDHGFEDPGYFGVAGVMGSGKDAIVHMLEEVYERHRETSWWCEKAAAIAVKYGRYRQRWYADPSRPDRIVDLKKAIRAALLSAGREPSTATVEEADNAIEAGVDAVADRLAMRTLEDGTKHARLMFAPSCTETIREIGVYRRKRDPRNPERVLDDILDRDNHSMDGVRYLIVTRFGRPVSRRHEQAPQDPREATPA